MASNNENTHEIILNANVPIAGAFHDGLLRYYVDDSAATEIVQSIRDGEAVKVTASSHGGQQTSTMWFNPCHILAVRKM